MKDGWKYKKLKEVSFYPNTRMPISKLTPDEYVGVENLVKDRGGVTFGKELPNATAAIAYEKKDILIGNIRPYLKKIWLSDKSGGTSGDIVLIRINDTYKSELSPVYLYKVLSSDFFFDYDNSNAKGAKMPRGDRNAIAEYIIPIPPIAEQERIVAELDLLTGIIDKQKAQLKELDTLAQSIFYDMFGDPVENEKGWKYDMLKNIAPTKQYNGLIQEHHGKFWLLNLDMVAQQSGEIIEKRLYHKDEIGTSTITFDETNVLYSKLRPYLNKVVLPDTSGYGTSELLPLKPNIALLDRRFLAYLLRSKSFVDYISVKVAGAKMPRVSMGDLQDFKIILPPLPLQQSFAEKIEKIEQQKSTITRSIAETQKLFDYTMDKYFG